MTDEEERQARTVNGRPCITAENQSGMEQGRVLLMVVGNGDDYGYFFEASLGEWQGAAASFGASV